jgi:hypothetical protein
LCLLLLLPLLLLLLLVISCHYPCYLCFLCERGALQELLLLPQLPASTQRHLLQLQVYLLVQTLLPH